MKQNFYSFDNNFNLKKIKNLPINNKNIKKISLEFYSEIGYYIITPLLFGVFLGLYLDKIFDKKNFFILIFIFLGAVFTFYNLYRIYKENVKK